VLRGVGGKFYYLRFETTYARVQLPGLGLPTGPVDSSIPQQQVASLCFACFQSSDDSLIFDTQLINWFVDTLSITIGINL
jgi:hypothetical protein